MLCVAFVASLSEMSADNKPREIQKREINTISRAALRTDSYFAVTRWHIEEGRIILSLPADERVIHAALYAPSFRVK